jgi:uncharacterized repeat protein (TIGR01451 family)
MKIWIRFLLIIAGLAFQLPAQSPVTDNFNTSTLNTSLWTFVNPVGDGSFSMTGTQLKLNVPAAANHVPGLNGTDSSVRMLQPIGNIDFTVTAKFDSIPAQGYTFEGILVHQDSSNYLLFQFGSTGSQLIVNSATIVNTVETSQQSATIAPSASSLWLRVQRSGNNWTESWSADGNTFSTVGTFTQALTTTDVGLWAGNYNGVTSSSPAYAALIDSFVSGAASAAPNLTITKSHSGNFTPGQTGATYTLTVTNSGTAASSGTVTVTDTVPSGLTAVSISGTGWTCTQPAGPCTRGDALAAGVSYSALTLTVNVASNASGTVVNTAAVSGGGNTSANTASDPTTISSSSAGAPVTDNFNTSTLNTGLWTFVNPVGDGSFSMTGTQLKLNVPAAANHVPGLNGTDTSVRMLQPIGNVDFTVTTKFDSIPAQQYQFEGILVHQDSSNYLLFQFGSTGSELIVNSAIIANTVETSQQSATIVPSAGSLWLRVQRTGNNWTESWSADGNTFSTVGTFTQALTTTDVGLWAGNYNGVTSSSPAYTALVDSFVSGAVSAPGSIISDDFTSNVLNTSVWAFVNPQNDGSFSLNGNSLLLNVPGGINHDVWTNGDNGVRVMQPAPDTDFEAEVKFSSPLNKQTPYQTQGIIVEQDASNFLRLSMYSDNQRTIILLGSVFGTTGNTIVSQETRGGSVTWMRVKRTGNNWLFSYSYDSLRWTSFAFTQALRVTRIGPFAGNAQFNGRSAPAFTAIVDHFVNRASPLSTIDGSSYPPPPAPPAINVWYGDNQTFGQPGEAQQWVNILGDVSDFNQVTTLTYSINGGAEQPLWIGENLVRLVAPGDFNVEIDYASLNSGTNTVRITATDVQGRQTVHNVSVNNVAGLTWPSNYSVNWSGITNIQSVAQVVDGPWAIQAGAARITETGYDRLIAIGDRSTWKNFVATAEVTMNSLDGYGFAVGIIAGWQGHTTLQYGQPLPDQPRTGHPFPGFGGYTDGPGGPPSLVIYENTPSVPEAVITQTGKTLQIGVKYIFKFQAQQNSSGGSHYSFKVWPASSREPANWDLQGDGELSLGSIVLAAHRADVSFGAVTVTGL